MNVMTVRNIPDQLLDFLRADAQANHRSLNEHLIAILEEYRAARLGSPAQRHAATQTNSHTH
jgi:plasmid stability protein